jgi:gluconate 2-dehydrogenase gamma chain
MSDVSRRKALGIMAAIPAVAALDPTPDAIERVARAVERVLKARERFEPKFFNAHEWRTARMLADTIIPRDARSGNATDAGVPEFMDFMMLERPAMQQWMRGGLRWLDIESGERVGKVVADLDSAQQSAILDDIAWPARAPAQLSHGVDFFNRFRDLTAAGFWSSRMGVEDLGYVGNTVVPEWKGCPDIALKHLGVSYDSRGQ